ncbi:acyl-CoA dehydrogenase domain protein [Mycobacterium xenopi 3993]|nr:acyl-CoA dehydrogenase domain protein [Mycobacterium xenopi 3993]
MQHHISYRIAYTTTGEARAAEKEHPSMAEVSDEDFHEILAQTRRFVRTAVVPREREILANDKVPDDLRDQAKKMGSSDMRSRRSGAGWA